MPKDFNRCVSEGGRVRTLELSSGRYMHICYDKNGKSHHGEIHEKKKEKKKIK